MRRKVAVEINVEAETDAQAKVAVQITLQAAGLPGECFRIWGAVMTSEQIECCRRIGRDEASRTAVIGLAELDALCDTAHGRWHGSKERVEGDILSSAEQVIENALLALPSALGPCPDGYVDVQLVARLPDALARKLQMGVHSGIREMANPPGKFLGMCEPLRPEDFVRPEDFERVIEASREVDAGKLADAQAERQALLSEALAEGEIVARAVYEGFLREMKAADLIGDYKMTGSDTALVRLKQPLRHVKIKRWVQE
jgi:hypothetical protein